MIGNVGIIGLILVLIGIYIGVKKSYKELFLYLVVTSILTTTTVIDIANKSITIPNMISLIYVFKIILGVYKKELKLCKLNKYLLLFVGYSMISITFPMIFSQGYQKIGESGIIKFEVGMLIQIVYLLIGVLVLYSTLILIKNKKINFENLDLAIRFIVCEIIILSIIQMINTDLFNQFLVNRKGQAFIQSLSNGKFRVTATFNEPSMLATILSIIIIYFLIRGFKNKKYLMPIIPLIIIGILSRGSTFFMIIILGGILVIIYMIREKKYKKLIEISISGIVIIAIINFIGNDFIYNEIIILINKLSGSGVSGGERIAQFTECFELFLKYPITGVGFGINRSADLCSTMLVNVGCIGVGLFLKFIYDATCFKKIYPNNLKAIKLAVLITTIILFISVPEMYYTYFWVVIAFSFTDREEKGDEKIKYEEKSISLYNIGEL